MSCSKMSLAIGAMLVVTFVVGAPTPASADPTGTTFAFLADNFQLDTDPTPFDITDPFAGGLDAFDPAVPFGVPTFIPDAGVTVHSMVETAHPAIPELGWIGGAAGGELLEFWFDTYTDGDGGFLTSDPGKEFAMIITGLGWGPDAPPAVATGAIVISFDIDGEPVELDPENSFGLPVLPNPTMPGFEATAIDISGDPADTIPFASATLEGLPMGALLAAITTLEGFDVLAVNSMHLSFEVIHIPEPATLALLGVGLCSTLLMRRRKR